MIPKIIAFPIIGLVQIISIFVVNYVEKKINPDGFWIHTLHSIYQIILLVLLVVGT